MNIAIDNTYTAANIKILVPEEADLKQQLTNWYANGKPEGQKPPKFEAWCGEHESETGVTKSMRNRYTNIDANREILKKVALTRDFSNIEETLKFIRETKKQLKLDAMTEAEKQALEDDEAEKAAAGASEMKHYLVYTMPHYESEWILNEPEFHILMACKVMNGMSSTNTDIREISKVDMNAAAVGRIMVRLRMCRLIDYQHIPTGRMASGSGRYELVYTADPFSIAPVLKGEAERLPPLPVRYPYAYP